MSNDDIQALLRELVDRDERRSTQSPVEASADGPPVYDLAEESSAERTRLDRSFASEYLDELIIALLLHREEANGMDIIREFSHRFGVQFSPGTVYPHLHSLEEEGILACRKCVQTKEYRIEDDRAARSHLESTLTHLSTLVQFLGHPLGDAERTE